MTNKKIEDIKFFTAKNGWGIIDGYIVDDKNIQYVDFKGDWMLIHKNRLTKIEVIMKDELLKIYTEIIVIAFILAIMVLCLIKFFMGGI